MQTFKSFFSIFNYKTVISGALAVACAYLCIRFEIKAEFPFYLISIAIVFPIVFSIDSAYKRREHALQFYADLKAHAISLYLGIKEWSDELDEEIPKKYKQQISELFKLIISRLHQYVSKMIVAYGIVRNVFYYRTPVALRAYSKVFIYLFPVIYGPYAASTYDDYSYGIAYVIAALYSIILICLDNLQEDLENPFDQIGKDDVNFEVDELDQILNNYDNK